VIRSQSEAITNRVAASPQPRMSETPERGWSICAEEKEMQNAHERFGTLEFTKRTKDTITRVRVHVDRAVLEPARDDRSPSAAHLISMVGGDAEIGALSAAITEGALYQIHLPGGPTIVASLGSEAQCFLGSVMVSGKKRPVRHLVAVSSELAKTKPGADREGARTILCSDDPAFVLHRVACRYGLPVVPEWAPWFVRELNQRKAINSLLGLGCSPVLVKGSKHTFLKWIGRALRERLIRIPAEKGSISWKLPSTFLEQSKLRPTSEERPIKDAAIVSA
jgi:hypothetical protein